MGDVDSEDVDTAGVESGVQREREDVESEGGEGKCVESGFIESEDVEMVGVQSESVESEGVESEPFLITKSFWEHSWAKNSIIYLIFWRKQVKSGSTKTSNIPACLRLMFLIFIKMLFGFFCGSKILILGWEESPQSGLGKGGHWEEAGGHGFDEKSMFTLGVASQGTEVNPFRLLNHLGTILGQIMNNLRCFLP